MSYLKQYAYLLYSYNYVSNEKHIRNEKKLRDCYVKKTQGRDE